MIFPDEGNCVAETLELIFFQILASVDDLGLTSLSTVSHTVYWATRLEHEQIHFCDSIELLCVRTYLHGPVAIMLEYVHMYMIGDRPAISEALIWTYLHMFFALTNVHTCVRTYIQAF